ncbi:MAG: LacI family transcriptional regulator [Proteobacteria bacterium]|nr:LacI family transcriptional regulator [Pseudomonadota bacterium]
MTITLKEIAKLAGVSTASVSRVINDKAVGNMRQETYDKIQAVIKETMYTPNPLAAGLRQGYTKTVGVIFPSNINPIYAKLGNILENEAFKHGYFLLLCNSHYDKVREKNYLNLLKQQRVSGVILSSTKLNREEIEAIDIDRNRLVVMDEVIEGYHGEFILGDDVAGGERAIGYLFGLGHSDILLICGDKGFASSANRIEGVKSTYRQWEKPFDEKMIFYSDNTVESAKRCISEAVRRKIGFSAVFAFNDVMAMGAIAALKHYGLRVPEDVSVVGYDNIDLGELFTPQITTVAPSSGEMMRHAFSSIMKANLPHQEIQPETTVFEPHLIIRESCQRYTG